MMHKFDMNEKIKNFYKNNEFVSIRTNIFDEKLNKDFEIHIAADFKGRKSPSLKPNVTA